MPKKIAVITGASQGLGKAFAEDCASRGYSLVLVALPGTGLPELARGIESRFAVDCLEIEADLTNPEQRQSFMETVLQRFSRIDVLINNAGTGQNGLFDLLPYQIQQKTIELNVQANMQLCYAFLPCLANKAESGMAGRIMMVASLAAFYPMPLFAVYAATKAFLLHFSLALRHEVSELGISVSALCPGGIITSPELREKVRSQGLLGRLSSMEPEKLARIALDGMLLGKALIIPGWFNRLLMVFGCSFPKNFTAGGIFSRWKMALAKVSAGKERHFLERKKSGTAA